MDFDVTKIKLYTSNPTLPIHGLPHKDAVAMYSSGIVRYHPLHDPESQQPLPRPTRRSIATTIDPRICRGYVAHATCSVWHFVMLLVAFKAWSSCSWAQRPDGSYCDADGMRPDMPFGAFVVAGIVGLVNWFLVMLTAPLESHVISLPLRESSAARYIIYYAGCIFCAGSAIVDFKYAVRASIYSSGWDSMFVLEICAVLAGLLSFYVVAVDGFRVYQAWNVAQVFASVPKIKVEDTSSDFKSRDTSILKA